MTEIKLYEIKKDNEPKKIKLTVRKVAITRGEKTGRLRCHLGTEEYLKYKGSDSEKWRTISFYLSENNNNKNLFYYFVSKLKEGAKKVEKEVTIPLFREQGKEGRFNWASEKYAAFSISNNKITRIAEKEKTKWDNLGYKAIEDLTWRNKRWVDKKIEREDKPREHVEELSDGLYDRLEKVEKGKLTDNNRVTKEEYDKGYERIYPDIKIQWKSEQSTKPNLPPRLIDVNVNNKRVIENSGKKNYAILSYVWGDWKNEKNKKISPVDDEGWYSTYKSESKKRGLELLTEKKLDELAEKDEWWQEWKEKKLWLKGQPKHPNPYKSLLKAVNSLKLVNKNVNKKIDYLWMDQMCKMQGESKAAQKEEAEMRLYYANSGLTLVSINTKLKDELDNEKGGEGDKIIKWLEADFEKKRNPIDTKQAFENAIKILNIIIRSEWHFSVWTFQEGWLSKQTIFMFDDILVDGRLLAMVWAQGYIENQPYGKLHNFAEFKNNYHGKYATHIGWAYGEEKKDYSKETLVSLSLNKALIALESRNKHGGSNIQSLIAILNSLGYSEPSKEKLIGELEKLIKEVSKEEKLIDGANKIIDSSSNDLDKVKKDAKDWINKCKTEKILNDNETIIYEELIDWKATDIRLAKKWIEEIKVTKKDKLEKKVNEGFQKALWEMMKVALNEKDKDGKIKEGNGEILGWFGSVDSNNNSQSWLSSLVQQSVQWLGLAENNSRGWLPAVKEKKVLSKDIFSTNIADRIEKVLKITAKEDAFNPNISDKIILNKFKEYPITDILSPIYNVEKPIGDEGPGKEKLLKKMFTVKEDGKIEPRTRFGERRVKVDNKEIILKGTKSTLGKKETELKKLKLLVPSSEYWTAFKIAKDGMEKEVSFALLVEKQGANKYERVDLVKLLDSEGENPEKTLNRGREFEAQIEIPLPK